MGRSIINVPGRSRESAIKYLRNFERKNDRVVTKINSVKKIGGNAYRIDYFEKARI